ncbi:hypothetical protein QBC40DRAFT_104356 [Triangularia verruculosa]|uniref:Uncharacterized protein n=1 Tax=Triangularia verruculosa TaxID=2587418 RepID=A0AAN6XR91_9PEZI|nr:hypothetical protein QBC40DRAFT_104356 [Triangularia verruculosa]
MARSVYMLRRYKKNTSLKQLSIFCQKRSHRLRTHALPESAAPGSGRVDGNPSRRPISVCLAFRPCRRSKARQAVPPIPTANWPMARKVLLLFLTAAWATGQQSSVHPARCDRTEMWVFGLATSAVERGADAERGRRGERWRTTQSWRRKRLAPCPTSFAGRQSAALDLARRCWELVGIAIWTGHGQSQSSIPRSGVWRCVGGAAR